MFLDQERHFTNLKPHHWFCRSYYRCYKLYFFMHWCKPCFTLRNNGSNVSMKHGLPVYSVLCIRILQLKVGPYVTPCEWSESTLSFLQATGKIVEKLRWHGSIIRDCSWHPYFPTLVSSSWDGYLVRWEATEDDKDPSMLKTGKQRMHPEGYTFSFVF